jgi:hypothetical protein
MKCEGPGFSGVDSLASHHTRVFFVRPVEVVVSKSVVDSLMGEYRRALHERPHDVDLIVAELARRGTEVDAPKAAVRKAVVPKSAREKRG